VHVKANIEAVLLVAAHKGFWAPDADILEKLARDFAQIVSQHGLPGSGHTRPDHPVMAFIAERLEGPLREAFFATLERAQQPRAPEPQAPSRVAELRAKASEGAGEAARGQASGPWLIGLMLTALALFVAGAVRGGR
jgi:cobaltochelatase CobN